MEATAVATRPGEGPSNVQAQRRRGWNVRRRRRRRREAAARNHHIPAHYASSNEARGQNLKAAVAPPLMHVMKYAVPSVLTFVTTLRYQGKPQLLENPGWSTWCFIAATGVYWLIVGEMKQMAPGGTRFPIYSGAALASAILSSMLLVSMLLPRPLSRIWMPLAVMILAGLILYTAYTLLYRGIKCVVNKLSAFDSSVTLLNSALPV